MITELRILPPLVVARLGSSAHPLENYNLRIPEDFLGFRKLNAGETLAVNEESGEISRAYTPDKVVFKDGDRIRPVAPFLEVFARTDSGELVPLTSNLLEANGLAPADLKWTVKLGNLKVFRRTGDPHDQVFAVQSFSDHEPHPLEGKCEHFIPGKVLPLGSVRYLKPNKDFPEIRLRFTPAAGKVYGSSLRRKSVDLSGNIVEQDDPIMSSDRLIYDTAKGKWRDYVDPGLPTDTNPGRIYAGFRNTTKAGGPQQSWGYLDDECDGIVGVELQVGNQTLNAFARVGAGPPTFAPDGLPIRTVVDELEQALLGPNVDPLEATLENVEEILRRGLETVRLMNTAVMNGNTINSRVAVASMMPSQDSNDTSRLFAPIMAPTLVDNLALVALHQAILAALRSGSTPWFLSVLRLPEEVGDLTDKGRRKMPAMMRGADGRYLTLTRRQIDTISKAAGKSSVGEKAKQDPKPLNLTAQLHHRARGNPPNTQLNSAISNCFPGLEFDFRVIWRRILVGVLIVENNNYVIDADDPVLREELVGHRLLRIDGHDVVTGTFGPVIPGKSSVPLATAGSNPVAFMEWSNTIAKVLQKQGQKVRCEFTKDVSEPEVLAQDQTEFLVKELEVRRIFERATTTGTETAVLSEGLLKPGELSQGLCSPWQNDYRECACYYWAASRPDYVNVVPADDGASRGDNWMQKDRGGQYVLDNRADSRLITYDELFTSWEKLLRFQIGGRDVEES